MTRRDSLNTGDDAAPPAWEHAATEWFFRRDRGLTAAEQVEFARWLAADARHATALAEIEHSWSDFGRLGQNLADRSRTRQNAGKIFWLRGAGWAAAAATVVFCASLTRFNWAKQSAITDYAAAPDAVRSVVLPDGSTVQLNAGSAIEVHFSAGERDVTLLRGEGHFAVAKNAARPFFVSAGAIAVRAVGTAFDVKLRPEQLEVLVTEGTVRLMPRVGAGRDDARATPVRGSARADTVDDVLLAAGERAIVSPEARLSPAAVAVRAIAPAEVEQALAWERRRLDYTDAALADIAADFNRYNAHKLIIADPVLAARHFGAAFPVNDYDAFVRLLESTAGVVVERRENDTILHLP